MIQVKFKNLEKSETAREAVAERIQTLVNKFTDLNESNIQVTLEMQNSPRQAGPDLFTVKVHVSGGRYKGLRLEKSAQSFYAALADLVDHMLEKLNRFGDRARVKERSKARNVLIDAERWESSKENSGSD